MKCLILKPGDTPAIEKLIGLEDMIGILDKNQEKRNTNSFQNLATKVKKITPMIFVKSDKTKNIYAISLKEYKRKLTDEITKHYKKVAVSYTDNIRSLKYSHRDWESITLLTNYTVTKHSLLLRTTKVPPMRERHSG